jgi:hypothetical protein
MDRLSGLQYYVCPFVRGTDFHGQTIFFLTPKERTLSTLTKWCLKWHLKHCLLPEWKIDKTTYIKNNKKLRFVQVSGMKKTLNKDDRKKEEISDIRARERLKEQTNFRKMNPPSVQVRRKHHKDGVFNGPVQALGNLIFCLFLSSSLELDDIFKNSQYHSTLSCSIKKSHTFKNYLDYLNGVVRY